MAYLIFLIRSVFLESRLSNMDLRLSVSVAILVSFKSYSSWIMVTYSNEDEWMVVFNSLDYGNYRPIFRLEGRICLDVILVNVNEPSSHSLSLFCGVLLEMIFYSRNDLIYNEQSWHNLKQWKIMELVLNIAPVSRNCLSCLSILLDISRKFLKVGAKNVDFAKYLFKKKVNFLRDTFGDVYPPYIIFPP